MEYIKKRTLKNMKVTSGTQHTHTHTHTHTQRTYGLCHLQIGYDVLTHAQTKKRGADGSRLVPEQVQGNTTDFGTSAFLHLL
jgi:hypothetical protein